MIRQQVGGGGGGIRLGRRVFGIMSKISVALSALMTVIVSKWEDILLWNSIEKQRGPHILEFMIYAGFMWIGFLEVMCLAMKISRKVRPWIETIFDILSSLVLFNFWVRSIDFWLWTQGEAEECCSLGLHGDTYSNSSSSCDLAVFKVIKQLCKDPSLQHMNFVPNVFLTIAAGVFMVVGYQLCCRPFWRNPTSPPTPVPGLNSPNSAESPFRSHVLPNGPFTLKFSGVSITVDPKLSPIPEENQNSPNSSGTSVTNQETTGNCQSQNSAESRSNNGSEFGSDENQDEHSQPLTQTARRRHEVYDDLFIPVVRCNGGAGAGGSREGSVISVSSVGTPRRSVRLSQTVKTNKKLE